MESSQQPESWRTAVQLEKRLRQETRKGGFWTPAMRELRSKVRDAYEAALFEDYTFCQAHDVEQQLWKMVYYRPIEEFRARIKTATAASTGAAPVAGATAQEAAQQLSKVTAAYKTFLQESIVQYRLLAARLQAVYGDVGVDLQLEPGASAQVASYAEKVSSRRTFRATDCRVSLHRILIYLGDLCRYASQIKTNDRAQVKTWQESAVKYYTTAAEVVPSSGNPYNQLAVMAYQSGQELQSVYFYFRALGASNPFLTARDNLLLLFENNRSTRYPALPQLTGTAAPSLSSVTTRYVRLASLMYDRINMETLADVRNSCTAAMRALTMDPSFIASQTSCTPAAAPLIQLSVMLIFAAHHLSSQTVSQGAVGQGGWDVPGGPAANGFSNLETARLQQALLKRVALTAIFDLAGNLSTAITSLLSSPQSIQTGNSNGSSNGSGMPAGSSTATTLHALLAPLNILLSWLVSSPADPLTPAPLLPAASEDAALPTKLAAYDEPSAAWNETIARAAFWRSALLLTKSLYAHPDSVMQPAGPSNANGNRLVNAGSAAGLPPSTAGMPEVQDLAGFVPLSEAHAVLLVQKSRRTRTSQQTSQTTGLHHSNGSDSSANKTAAAKLDSNMGGGVDGNISTASAALQQQPQRVQHALFWLSKVAAKAPSLQGIAQTCFAHRVKGVGVQNLEQATKLFAAGFEGLSNLPPPTMPTATQQQAAAGTAPQHAMDISPNKAHQSFPTPALQPNQRNAMPLSNLANSQQQPFSNVQQSLPPQLPTTSPFGPSLQQQQQQSQFQAPPQVQETRLQPSQVPAVTPATTTQQTKEQNGSAMKMPGTEAMQGVEGPDQADEEEDIVLYQPRASLAGRTSRPIDQPSLPVPRSQPDAMSTVSSMNQSTSAGTLKALSQPPSVPKGLDEMAVTFGHPSQQQSAAQQPTVTPPHPEPFNQRQTPLQQLQQHMQQQQQLKVGNAVQAGLPVVATSFTNQPPVNPPSVDSPAAQRAAAIAASLLTRAPSNGSENSRLDKHAQPDIKVQPTAGTATMMAETHLPGLHATVSAPPNLPQVTPSSDILKRAASNTAPAVTQQTGPSQKLHGALTEPKPLPNATSTDLQSPDIPFISPTILAAASRGGVAIPPAAQGSKQPTAEATPSAASKPAPASALAAAARAAAAAAAAAQLRKQQAQTAPGQTLQQQPAQETRQPFLTSQHPTSHQSAQFTRPKLQISAADAVGATPATTNLNPQGSLLSQQPPPMPSSQQQGHGERDQPYGIGGLSMQLPPTQPTDQDYSMLPTQPFHTEPVQAPQPSFPNHSTGFNIGGGNSKQPLLGYAPQLLPNLIQGSSNYYSDAHAAMDMESIALSTVDKVLSISPPKFERPRGNSSQQLGGGAGIHSTSRHDLFQPQQQTPQDSLYGGLPRVVSQPTIARPPAVPEAALNPTTDQFGVPGFTFLDMLDGEDRVAHPSAGLGSLSRPASQPRLYQDHMRSSGRTSPYDSCDPITAPPSAVQQLEAIAPAHMLLHRK